MSRVPIFLINLDRSPDRLSFMQQQAERLSFAFERIRGVDGVRGLPDWLIPQFLSSDGTIASRMSNGEVATPAISSCFRRWSAAGSRPPSCSRTT
jgi:GR25 family glycosyltransferase involved in LPS biosynthesis